MKQFFTGLFLLWVLGSFSQQETGGLRGSVVSGKDTLQLASLMLLKTTFNDTTDNNGNFEMRNIPPGKYQLRVSYIGYENFQQEVEVKAGEVTKLKIELVPLTAQIKELVVTGNMNEASKLNSVTPIDVYTTQYFLRNPTNNIWDALSFVNGIFPDVDNGVANTSDIQINGIEGNYTETLIDGVPAMNGLAGIYAFTAFPMSIIDKIEVEKGASGTLYGSDAMAGVINIITKNPDNAPTFYTNIEMTSYLETTEDFSASFKLKKVSAIFSLSGENMNTRWELNPEKDGFMDIPLTNRVNFFNKWNIARKDDRVATVYARYLFEDRFGGQIGATRSDIGSNTTYTQWIRTDQWQAGFKYQLPLKEKVMLMADYSEHYQTAYFGNLFYNGRQRVVFTQLSWNKKVDKHNDLLMGLNYRMKYYVDNTQLSDKYITGTGPVSHIAGAFMEDEISIAEGHKLILGCRFDYNNRVGPFATPRADYKWNSKDEQNVLRFGLGTGYRVPDLFNDGYGAMAQGMKVVIPVKLMPESDLTLNANYTRVQKLPLGILSLDISAFYTYFMSYIDPDYSMPGEVMYYNSKNGLDAPGFSGSADFVFQFPLKIGLSFYYVDVWEVDTVNGIRVKSLTQHSPHLTTNFYFSYSIPSAQLSFDWTGNVVSPMLLVTEPNDFRPSMSPWYTIQNIQVTKKFKKGVEVYFGIKNLFNFMQYYPIMRPFDPFNRYVNIDNPEHYVFDTQYGFINNEGIKGFVGFRYTFH